MNPKQLSADERNRAPESGFKAREFWRVVGLTRPYRRTLVLGLVITVGFAGLHTISIGAAFPVFQVLLEDEGLHGCVDRTIAAHRLGGVFGPPTDADSVRAVKVASDGELARAGIRPGEDLYDASSRPIKTLLRELAEIEPGEEATVAVGPPEDRRTATVRPERAAVQFRLLRWGGSFLPPDSEDTKLRTLAYILVGLVLIVVVANVLRFTGEVLIAGSVLRAMMDLRDRLYVQTLHLPMVYYSGVETSDLVSRFVQDVQEIQRGLVTLFGKAIREPLRAMFLVGLALMLDWRITLTMVLVVPVAAVVFIVVGRKVKNANRKLLQAYGSMIGALTTSLQNLRVVKAYTAEDHERARLDVVDKRVLGQQLKLAKLDAFLSPMMETLAVFAGSLLMIWLASKVLDHTLPVPTFGTLGLTLSMLFDPLRKLTDVYVRIQRSTAGAERIYQVLDQTVESEQPADSIGLVPLQKSIEVVNVSFTYPNATSPALAGVSLTIERGETVAIVGPNGSGKTTLVSMLPRLFDPDSGEIRYDGVDIRRAHLRSLRRQFGLVSQEAIVFAGTPVDNIAYGRSVDNAKQVQGAAREAHADEFIRKIPGEYHAVLGERGTTLSGGERQRLAIARAIYRDAPILIFDEATSQIDTESELKIQTAVREFAKHRTTIIVAHRLSTIQFANRIVVMDAGRVIDNGSHKELYDRCGLYRALCDTQFVGGVEGT